MKEAYYYKALDQGRVQCLLCPHNCKIQENHLGRCQVRKNSEGKLYSLNYGRVTGLSLDPIEKKPLKHFCSGKKILSLGTFGCNFHCGFCQNWHIAKSQPFVDKRGIDELLKLMVAADNNIGMAYTYNEPIVFYEFMLDMAKAVKNRGYKNVVVSNGFINKAPLQELLLYVDAFNIDLKAFSDHFYKEICGGERLPVMKTIERIYGQRHIELTLLLIDDQNTNDEALEEMFKWISSIDPAIPIHINRYFPAYKFHQSPTKLITMEKVKKMAEGYLKHVYLGNMPK